MSAYETEYSIRNAIRLAGEGKLVLYACLPENRKAVARRVREMGAKAKIVEHGVEITVGGIETGYGNCQKCGAGLTPFSGTCTNEKCRTAKGRVDE